MAKLKIRKGDKVAVIAGKDKGKEGRVLATFPHNERVLVEHVAIAKKAARPTQQNPQGGIIEIEKPIHVSNVKLICPKCSQATRVSVKRVDGARVRVCKKCGNDID